MTKKLALTSDGSRSITIAARLTDKLENALVTFLWDNSDVFAWEASGLPGVPREVIEYKLAVNKDAKPVKQVLRKQARRNWSSSSQSWTR